MSPPRKLEIVPTGSLRLKTLAHVLEHGLIESELERRFAEALSGSARFQTWYEYHKLIPLDPERMEENQQFTLPDFSILDTQTYTWAFVEVGEQNNHRKRQQQEKALEVAQAGRYIQLFTVEVELFLEDAEEMGIDTAIERWLFSQEKEEDWDDTR